MWRVAGLATVTGCAILLSRGIADAGDTGVVTATVVVAGDLSVELRVPERKVKAGNPFQLEARVSASNATAGQLTLHHPYELRVRGGDSVTVTLRPGHSRTIRWSVCAEPAGQHVVMASFVGGGMVGESIAEVVEIEGGRKAACPRPWR